MRVYAIHAALILVNAIILAIVGAQGALAGLSGCDNCISAGDISRGAVRASELSNDLDNSITRNDIARGGVGSSEIANGSVAERDLGFDPVTEEELASRLGGWMHPTAWGFVHESGTVAANSGGITSVYDAANARYMVSFDEFVYAVNGHATMLTPVCDWAAKTRYDSVSGDLAVYLEDAAGSNVRCSFSFVVY